MPSTSTVNRTYNWTTTQRNLTIFMAILVAVPTTYGFQSMVSGGGSAGDFLLLMTLAVGVPTAYDEYWPQYNQTWKAIAWVLAACFLVTIEFVGLYLIGTDYVGFSPFYASIGAFLVTDLGNFAWLSIRTRN